MPEHGVMSEDPRAGGVVKGKEERSNHDWSPGTVGADERPGPENLGPQ
jgi:hypothetical protein